MPNNQITDGTRDLIAAIIEALDIPVCISDDARPLRNAAADVVGVLRGIDEHGATHEAAAFVLRNATATNGVGVLAS